MNHTFIIVFVAATLIGCTADFSESNNLHKEEVESVSLMLETGSDSITIHNKREIEFIFRELGPLPSRKEGKVNPEFFIAFHKHDGTSVIMRMENGCIGPNIAASAVVDRWYFHTDTLYRYFLSKFPPKISEWLTVHKIARQGDTIQLRYEDYPTQRISSGIHRAVDLSSDPMAKTYQTVLQRAAKNGPNFASHYTIATWGCGTSTQAFAIIDAITGKVYFSGEIPYVSWAGYYGDEYGLHFRRDSRLLVVFGRRQEEDPAGIFYYEWKNEHLHLIKYIHKVFPRPQ